MGRLKNFIEKSNLEIVNYLLKAGFKYETFICGSNHGYQRGFSVEEGLYFTYVHCDLENRKLNIYKEYDCGGEVASCECNIPNYFIDHDDVDGFIDWLDKKTESYL